MQSKAATVDEYIAEQPEDRREAIETIRRVVNDRLPQGYEEGMQYGMISWHVPHRVYRWGYHCDPSKPVPFAALASQKRHIGIYLLCIYGDEEHRAWFEAAWKATGRKLDMGRGCVRVKSLDDVPLDVLGESIARVPADAFIRHYEAAIAGTTAGRKLAKLKEKAVQAAGG